MTREITETELVQGFLWSINSPGMYASRTPNGEIIIWAYRAGRDDEGYDPICGVDSAAHVTIEYGNRRGSDISLDNPRPDTTKLQDAHDAVYGDKIKD